MQIGNILNKSPEDFIVFCSSKDGKSYCADSNIWREKLEKDFFQTIRGKNRDKILSHYRTIPKQAYLSIVMGLSDTSEKITNNIIESLGDFSTFVDNKYRKIVTQFFFTYIVNLLTTVDSMEEIRDYFWTHQEWKNFLPQMYRTDYYDNYWNDEILYVIIDYIDRAKDLPETSQKPAVSYPPSPKMEKSTVRERLPPLYPPSPEMARESSVYPPSPKMGKLAVRERLPPLYPPSPEMARESSVYPPSPTL